MINPFHPDRLHVTLVTETCPKMRRAWRNRSDVTQWQWVAFARKLQGHDANQDRIWKIAACLYVACSWYVSHFKGVEVFIGSDIPTRGWSLIGLIADEYYHNLPDRALTRDAWEAQKRQEAKDRKAAQKKT